MPASAVRFAQSDYRVEPAYSTARVACQSAPPASALLVALAHPLYPGSERPDRPASLHHTRPANPANHCFASYETSRVAGAFGARLAPPVAPPSLPLLPLYPAARLPTR